MPALTQFTLHPNTSSMVSSNHFKWVKHFPQLLRSRLTSFPTSPPRRHQCVCHDLRASTRADEDETECFWFHAILWTRDWRISSLTQARYVQTLKRFCPVPPVTDLVVSCSLNWEYQHKRCRLFCSRTTHFNRKKRCDLLFVYVSF